MLLSNPIIKLRLRINLIISKVFSAIYRSDHASATVIRRNVQIQIISRHLNWHPNSLIIFITEITYDLFEILINAVDSKAQVYFCKFKTVLLNHEIFYKEVILNINSKALYLKPRYFLNNQRKKKWKNR